VIYANPWTDKDVYKQQKKIQFDWNIIERVVVGKPRYNID